jgi:hypothetical protein
LLRDGEKSPLMRLDLFATDSFVYVLMSSPFGSVFYLFYQEKRLSITINEKDCQVESLLEIQLKTAGTKGYKYTPVTA